MAREHVRNKVDVKKIMSEIREKILQEKNEEKSCDSMFNREIDVASVMRSIQDGCSSEKSFVEISDNFSSRIDEIYFEIERINEFVEGTRKQALRHMEPGCIIPVNPSRPVVIQKILTLCKRLVRKATRFLVLDQMAFNVRVNECIKALRESQEQNLKLIKMIEQLYLREAALRSEVELNAKIINGKFIESGVRSKNQIATLTDAIDDVHNRYIEIQKQIAAHNKVSDDRQEVLYSQQVELKEWTEEYTQKNDNRYDLLSSQNTELRAQLAEYSQMNDRRYSLLSKRHKRLQEHMAEYVQLNNDRNDVLNNRNAELQERIATYNQDMVDRLEEIDRLIRKLEKNKSDAPTNELYVQFENEFGSTEAEIKKRQEFYLLKYVQEIIQKKEEEVVLDLGCGRGEWLDLLRGAGYLGKGIDHNPAMISLCTSKGLDAKQGDVLDYLKSLKDCSIKMITGFQIAEHLSMQTLSELIKEAYRVLEYHGMLILETPNSKNIEVGSANFYVDPTHIRPLHPDYLQFLARTTGFYKTDIAMWKQAEIQEWVDSVIATDETAVMQSPVVRTMLESMKAIMYNSPDYAMIAIK